MTSSSCCGAGFFFSSCEAFCLSKPALSAAFILNGGITSTSDVSPCQPDAKIGEEMDTLGLYLSIPFCKSKCTYCNFASGVFPSSYFGQYIARLEDDLHAIRGKAAQWGAALPEIVDTVYLGGGTPSLLPPELLTRLFAAIRREFIV